MLYLSVSKAFTREDDAAETDIVRRPPPSGAVHLTRDGLERLRTELAELERDRRAMGADANAVALLDRRMREVQQSIAAATVVDVTGEPDVVRFGACVYVRSVSDGEESDYRIVGPAEADPARGMISSLSPLAQALLNRRAGERVSFKYPAGEDTLEILRVSY